MIVNYSEYMSAIKKNITHRIEELNTSIHKLEKKLAVMIWERNKYIQFSKTKPDSINKK